VGWTSGTGAQGMAGGGLSRGDPIGDTDCLGVGRAGGEETTGGGDTEVECAGIVLRAWGGTTTEAFSVGAGRAG